MRINNALRPLRLDTGLGASEEQTEVYLKYIEGVPQLATTTSAKSISRVGGSAAKQADTAQELYRG